MKGIDVIIVQLVVFSQSDPKTILLNNNLVNVVHPNTGVVAEVVHAIL